MAENVFSGGLESLFELMQMNPSEVAYAQTESSIKTDCEEPELKCLEELVVEHEERQSQQTGNCRMHQCKKKVVGLEVVQ